MQPRSHLEGLPGLVAVDAVSAIKKAMLSLRKQQKHRIPRYKLKLPPTVEKLLGVTIHSHEILFRANTVFPFTLFPDTIVIDKEKLTIIERFFFWVAKITSVPIRDILNVEADVGPFFGSIHLTSRYFFTNPRSIKFLWRKDTMKVQRLLQGFIIAHERHIDCSSIDTAQLEILLEDLGETNANLRYAPHRRA